MQSKTWIISIDHTTYKIEFTNIFFKKELLVNSIPIKLEPSKTFGITRETTFNLGNVNATLVNIDRESDIVIDGTYLNSGKNYISVKRMPYWNFIFLGLILLIYLFSYNSICAALFTLVGLYFLIRMSIEPSLKIKARIIFCFFITLSMHLFFWNVLNILITIL